MYTYPDKAPKIGSSRIWKKGQSVPVAIRMAFQRGFDLDKHYAVGRPLGNGFFGNVKVYHRKRKRWHQAMMLITRKKDNSLPEKIAVKTFHRFSDRHARELEVSESICQGENDNIVKAFGIGTDPDNPVRTCLVMEVCHRDLRTHMKINGGKLDRACCREILFQVSSGLKYLKGENIVHRDVNPSNVLLRSLEPIEVVIADFGIVLTDVKSTYASKTTAVVGKYAYMAPEILDGRRPGKPDLQVYFT